MIFFKNSRNTRYRKRNVEVCFKKDTLQTPFAIYVCIVDNGFYATIMCALKNYKQLRLKENEITQNGRLLFKNSRTRKNHVSENLFKNSEL